MKRLILLCLAVAIPLSASAFWPFTHRHAKPYRVPPPTLPPALTNVSRADVTKSLNFARQVKSIEPPPCTTCPRIYGWVQFTDTTPEFAGDYISTFWDQLQFQWYYKFETAPNPNGPWTVRAQGLWTSSDTNAFYGLDLRKDQVHEYQRGEGTPMAVVAMENVSAPFMPLQVHYKNQPYRPWWRVRK